MHISASTAPIRVKQKPLYSQLNAECDKHYYNNLFKYLENPPESLPVVCWKTFGNSAVAPKRLTKAIRRSATPFELR